ncbi:hypothetical protein JTB14_020270 [Gonioctena quinquepunctata]|nr:hypothetical protein JTB14_020270 [Gonioctena quinquepunctata]
MKTVLVEKRGIHICGPPKKGEGNVQIVLKIVEIRSIQKINVGDLLIPVRKGSANILKDEIIKTGIDARTKKPRKSTKYCTSETDEVTTKEEVERAVKQIVDQAEFTLSSLRPGYRSTQNITLEIDNVVKSRFGERIKIGLTKCRIEERVEAERCYRCWSTRHRFHQCNGEEKKNYFHN